MFWNEQAKSTASLILMSSLPHWIPSLRSSASAATPTFADDMICDRLEHGHSPDPAARFLSRWVRRVKELVRAGHRVKHDDHLVGSDAEALVDYPTLASYGWTSGTLGITVEIEATTPTFVARLSPLTQARNAERRHDPLVSRLR